MDRSTRILTVIICLIIMASMLSLFLTLGDSPEQRVIAGFAAILILGSLVAAYAFHPRSYRIEGGKLIIQKGIGRKEIQLNGISAVREVNKNDLGKGVRTFGVGGLFGYFGKFYFSKVGTVTAYVTHPGKTILITTQAHQYYLISPGDTLGFMNSIHEELPALHPFTETTIVP